MLIFDHLCKIPLLSQALIPKSFLENSVFFPYNQTLIFLQLIFLS